MQKVFVTGAAGFIASNLVDRLLALGKSVVGWDNFSTGQPKFLEDASQTDRFRLVKGDNLDLDLLTEAMAGCDFVFHLAANADVRFGLEHPRKDLEQNTVATFHVLEAMRANQIGRLAFASTGSVYGEAEVIPTPENAAFPIQTSLYGASKVAGESLIQAYCEGFGLQSDIFRFVSILGERYTHGHVFDFLRQLRNNPEHLRVLGNGQQKKSYLYVQDCLAAMLHAIQQRDAGNVRSRCAIYNLGTAEFCTVTDSVGWICERLGAKPKIEYTGGERGWIGDNPFIFLDTKKICATGWQPSLSIRAAVERTVDWLCANPWVFSEYE
jgi:UDP-glucose 4-epimerase